MAAPEICALIATLGESAALERTLAAVRAQCQELGAELVLAVNAAPQAFPAARRARWDEFADRVVYEPRSGKSHALNAGLAATAAELIAFTDDDALPYRDWLAAITAPLRAGGAELAGAGGRVVPVFPAGGPPAWYRRLLAGRTSSFLGPLHDLGPEACDYPAAGNTSVLPLGANCAYRRAALLPAGYHTGLGPSRTSGLRGGEDTELALRLQHRGLRLRWAPAALVHHPVEPDRMRLGFVREGYRLQGVEAVRFLRAVGLPTRSVADARRRLRRHRLRRLLAVLARPDRALREELRCRFYQGMLAELRAEEPA